MRESKVISLQYKVDDEYFEEQTEISFNEEVLFDKFIAYSHDLQNCAFVSGKIHLHMEIDLGEDPNNQVSAKLPDWELVQAFLHRFKPFYLNNEETSFRRICNKLLRKFSTNPLKNQIIYLINFYNGNIQFFDENGNNIGFQYTDLDTILDNWLNSYEYHKDNKKKVIFDGWAEELQPEAKRGFLLLLLRTKAQAILELNDLLNVVLGKENLLNLYDENRKRKINIEFKVVIL